MTDSEKPSAAVRVRRRRVRTWQVLAVWFVAMLPLTNWGLPSSRQDGLLFGGRAPWPAERYAAAAALAERAEREAGADVDLDPLPRDRRILTLTEHDAGRAQLLRRYRLYTRQPDEMITFMALQRMRPGAGDFDPRLYQYGGGFIYLVGAMCGAASAAGLVTISSDAGLYLEQPEQFARFYLVGRLVVLVFGAALLAAVVRLARLAAGRTAGWVAFVLVAASPVFLSGVLEAKPHLPSVCMILWGALAALRLLGAGGWRASLGLGVGAGYAAGLVLTGVVSAGLWLVPVSGPGWRVRLRWLLVAAGVAVLVYVATNPYLLWNVLVNPAALSSNLKNSTDMYSVGRVGEGALRVGQLLLECVGFGALAGGVIGAVALVRRYPREVWTVAAPALLMVVICVLIGAGKPAEFARFLLLPAVVLCVACAALLARLAVRHAVISWAGTVAVLLMMATPAYVSAFVADARLEEEPRRRAGEWIAANVPGGEAIGVLQEPAPYAVPPLDFTQRELRLLPLQIPTRHEMRRLPPWLVLTCDGDPAHLPGLPSADGWWLAHYEVVARFPPAGTRLSPITWASKPTFVLRRMNGPATARAGDDVSAGSDAARRGE